MTLAEAVERIRKSKLKKHADEIAGAIRPAVCFEYQHDADAKRGCCKLGGKPDLPKGTEWPQSPDERPLAFLAQFDLAQCRVESKEWPLPAEGLLSFFYDAEDQPWGISAKDFGAWRVLYIPPGTPLAATPYPKNLDDDARFEAVVLKPHPVHSLPSRCTIVERELTALEAIDDSLEEAYDELAEELESAPGLTLSSPQLGGWPREIQNEMSGSFARLVPDKSPAGELRPNPFKPGEMMMIKGPDAADAPPALRALLRDTTDWTLLLQLPSDEDDGPGWMWGDVGRLYYWTPLQALQAKRFEDCWLELQCY